MVTKFEDISEDDLYKENLIEWVYDQKKLITYHYLSVTLGVHVNLAKQMLYEFYNEQELQKTDSKNGKKKLEATFYVSGIEAGRVENGSENKNHKPLKYTSTLCSADNLEQLKNQLDEIFSIHIYSVHLKESKETLGIAIKETLLLTNNDGKSGVDFGPFKLQKAQILSRRKQSESINAVPVMNIKTEDSTSDRTTSKTKSSLSNPVKDSKPIPANSRSSFTKDSKSNQSKESKINFPKEEKTSQPASSKKAPILKDTKSSNSKLKDSKINFPKEEKTSQPTPSKAHIPKDSKSNSKMKDSKINFPKESKDTKPTQPKDSRLNVSRNSKLSTRVSASKKNNTKEKEAAPQRKRIKMLISSSEDDDSDSNRSSAESDNDSPESPIPKRRLIVSDSESDDEEPFHKNVPSPPTVLPLPVCKPGRKRVTKVVATKVVDEEGYTVIKKEQVVVSESESDSDTKVTKGKTMVNVPAPKKPKISEDAPLSKKSKVSEDPPVSKKSKVSEDAPVSKKSKVSEDAPSSKKSKVSEGAPAPKKSKVKATSDTVSPTSSDRAKPVKPPPKTTPQTTPKVKKLTKSQQAATDAKSKQPSITSFFHKK